MTNIVSQSADFSKNPDIAGYNPPVKGFDVLSWFGYSLANSTRNFGTGDDITKSDGSFTGVDDYYLTVQGGRDSEGRPYFTTDVTASSYPLTLFCVAKQDTSGDYRGVIPTYISNEAVPSDSTRQGINLYVSDGKDISLSVYTNESNGSNTRASVAGGKADSDGQGDPTQWSAFAATINSDGTNLILRVMNLSSGEEDTATVALSDLDISQANALPLRIGNAYYYDADHGDDLDSAPSYRNYGKAQIMCAGIATSIISDDDLQKMYRAAKARAANAGITI